VDHSILVPTEDGERYRFRHELLRAAVYDDILPANRITLHQRIADALEDGGASGSGLPAAASAELARHREAGRQFDAAREAYRLAGELAFRAHAWTEAATSFERFLEIERTHGPESQEIDVRTLCQAAQAIWFAGRQQQAREFLRGVLESLPDHADPIAAAEGWMTFARIVNDMGDDKAARAASDRAAAIAPRRPVTNVRLRILADRAGTLAMDAQYRAAIRLADKVIARSKEIAALDVAVAAMAQRGGAQMGLGHRGKAERDLDEGRRIGMVLDDPDPLGVVLFNIGYSFQAIGAFRESLAVLEEAATIGADLGLERSWGPWLSFAAADACFWLGRWDEADRHLAAARAYDLDGMTLTGVANVEAALAAHRDDGETVRRATVDLVRSSPPIGEFAGWWRATLAQERLIAGDPLGAIAWVDDALAVLAGSDEVSTRSRVASLGAEASADLADRTRARLDTIAAIEYGGRAELYAALAVDAAGGRLVRDSSGSPLAVASARYARAHAGRANGADEPGSWRASVEAFESIGLAPMAARARYRQAEAEIVAGDREAARASLGSARDAAAAIGIPTLIGRIDGLARRARLELVVKNEATRSPEPSLADSSDREGHPWGLSAREVEVLELVADGMTNREIARRLFIAEKTASVHVTHILDKVGVSSRTEAALAAVNAGMIPVSARVGSLQR
jgi:DNA-binding CsgD family transcriptional regulator/tetratricopeptide (TPR) repeat protein